MPLYLCRWENGDCSFVWALNKGHALEVLDEVGNAEGCPINVSMHLGTVGHKTVESGVWYDLKRPVGEVQVREFQKPRTRLLPN